MTARSAILAAAAAACLGLSAARSEDIPGWDGFTSALHDLAPKMIAKLPPRLRHDPQTRAEIGRLMLESVAVSAINAVSEDGDHPMFLPSLNLTLNVFQPNADTTYRNTDITPGGTYRLRGRLGSLRLVKLGEIQTSPGDGGALTPMLAYHDFTTLHLDAQGRYDVILSPARPANYTGDWWQLDPRTTALMVRQVAYDWPHEQDPTIAIERVDAPATRHRPSAAVLQARMRRLAAATVDTALAFVDHVEGLRKGGFINKLHVFDVSHMGGLVGQFYYEGAYELKPDEALIVEAKVPDKCTYSSIILTNDIYETTDWYNNESSLNGSQVRVDADGVLRIVIAGADPGVPNWLDTAGYNTGAVQGRWTNCSSNPIPSERLVKLADIRKLLPPDTPTVTPAQRDQIVRDRRATLQQRPLW